MKNIKHVIIPKSKGNIMKTWKNSSCHSIYNNHKYFCTVSNKVNVYSIDDFSHICTFSDMRYYGPVKFINETTLVIKNNLGIYKIYDIISQQCLKTIRLKGLRQGGQNSVFIISPQKDYIYDILIKKAFSDVWFVKIRIADGETEHIRIGDDIRVTKDLTYDHERYKVLFFHTKMADSESSLADEVNEIYSVDLHHMTVNVEYSCIFPREKRNIFFFCNKFLLNSKMEMIDIYTNSIIKTINFDFDYFYKHGGFLNCFFISDMRFLVMVNVNSIIIIDFQKGYEVYKYTDAMCCCVAFIGEHMLVGEANRILIDNNPILNLID
jgi:hypothetical protein